MNTSTMVLIVVAAIILLVVGGYLGVTLSRRQRTRFFQKRFGPEYERTLKEVGDRREVERVLAARIDHVKSLDIRPLSQDEKNHFMTAWLAAQVQFVDEPLAAIKTANRLIREAMAATGYPVDDFEQRAADISVDYPELVDDYRGLHSIAMKEEVKGLDTEEMRQAMLHGRSLFDNLLNEETEDVEEPQKETA